MSGARLRSTSSLRHIAAKVAAWQVGASPEATRALTIRLAIGGIRGMLPAVHAAFSRVHARRAGRRYGRILNLAAWLALVSAHAADWPQWLGPQRDGVWRETGILETFPPGGLTVRWRTPIGAGYAGPAVVADRVYVTDRVMAPSANNPSAGGAPRRAGFERVLCLSAVDGRVLWQHEYECAYRLSYPAGPRTTPLVHQGKVYTLGAEGHLLCLEAASGKVVWSRDFKRDYQAKTPMWGFSSHPLVEGQKLICLAGGEGSVVVALDKDTGKEIWRALSAAEPGYGPPMIYEAGGRRQLIVWHPEALNSLDPETGKTYWTQPFSARAGMTIATPRKLGDRLLVSCFYNGSLMMRLDPNRPAATLLWRGRSNSERNTDGLHAVMCTPWLEGGYIYGVCSYGQLRCLKADTGERVWETFAATTGREVRWANAFIVKCGDRFFLPNESGELVLAKLTPQGYQEIGRAHLLEPTNRDCGRPVVWSHPAFANRCLYARNDRELICVSLAAEGPRP
jgi:outer membrane protein assembly factor BamB